MTCITYATCRLRHVVVDEADLLLGGGYAKALWQVIDWMRAGDKERKIEALCQAVGASPASFHSLPYNIRKQALEGAVLSEASAASTLLLDRSLVEETLRSTSGCLPSGLILFGIHETACLAHGTVDVQVELKGVQSILHPSWRAGTRSSGHQMPQATMGKLRTDSLLPQLLAALMMATAVFPLTGGSRQLG